MPIIKCGSATAEKLIIENKKSVKDICAKYENDLKEIDSLVSKKYKEYYSNTKSNEKSEIKKEIDILRNDYMNLNSKMVNEVSEFYKNMKTPHVIE